MKRSGNLSSVEQFQLEESNATRINDIQVSVQKPDPTQIVLHNVTYTIKDKPILSQVTTVFQPGKLSVIVGPSGSGKTSLLTLVAGLLGSQPKGSQVTGDILYNGQTLAPEKIKKIVGFVFQDDVILETMTVKEAISMSIELRVNQHNEAKKALLRRMLDISQLDKARDVIIGSPAKKGISGGERKRTAIAMELVSNPSVLLLDEPTSGLDTYTAFRIIALLKRLAHKYGRTVIATLHQPSSEIFHMIDDLFVLHEGKLVYGGPAKQLVPYFSGAGYHFQKYSNPLDVLFMDVLNQMRDDDITEEAQQLTRVDANYIPVSDLSKYYARSNLFHTYILDVILLQQGVTKEMHRFRAKKWFAFQLLLLRDMKNVLRNPMIARTKLFQTLFLAGFIALVFYPTRSVAPPFVFQNLAGVLFFFVTNAFFASFQNVLPVFSAEKPSFAREHAQGYYSTTSYFFAKILVELPMTFFFPVLTAVICYWSIGLRPGLNHFLIFTLILQMTALTGFSLGLFVASLFDDVSVALALSILFILPMMITGGLFLNVETLPSFLQWLPWFSAMKYAFTSLMLNQFDGWDVPGSQAYLDNIGIKNGLSMWVNIFILGGIFVVALAGAFVILSMNVRKKEHGKISLFRKRRLRKQQEQAL